MVVTEVESLPLPHHSSLCCVCSLLYPFLATSFFRHLLARAVWHFKSPDRAFNQQFTLGCQYLNHSGHVHGVGASNWVYSYENIKVCIRSVFLGSQRPQFLIRLKTSLMSPGKVDTLVVSIFQTSNISGVMLWQEFSAWQHPQYASSAQLLYESICARV